MKTIIKLLTITTFVFVFAFAAQAKTVNVTDFGAVANDNADDTDAVRAAAVDLTENGGGTLVFPSGTIDLKGDVTFETNVFQSYRIVGDKGSYVRLDGTNDTDFFVFPKAKQVEFDGLIMFGNPTNDINARRVIVLENVGQTKIVNSAFYGIGAENSIVESLNNDLIVKDTQFEGVAAKDSVVRAYNSRGVNVENVSFLDNANFLEFNISKSGTVQAESWVKVSTQNLAQETTEQRIVTIKNCRFEASARRAIVMENQSMVEVNGIKVNVSRLKGGAAVYFSNVGYGEVTSSSFGYTGFARPAILAVNYSYVEVNALRFSDGVVFMTKDASSSSAIRYCPGCLSANLVENNNVKKK